MQQQGRRWWAVGLMLALMMAAGCAKDGPGSTDADPAPTGEAVDLQLTFTEGKSWNMLDTNSSSITRTVQGKEVTTEQSLTRGRIITVESVEEDGSAWLAISHDSFAIEYESVDQKTDEKVQVKFDSTTDPVSSAGGEAKAHAAFLGLSFRVHLSEQGKVLAISGLDEFYRGYVKNLNLPEGVDTKLFIENMKNMYGENFFREELEDILAVYPDKPLNVGDTWETQDEFNVGFPVAQERTHTLKEIRDGVVSIEVNAEIDPGQEKLSEMMLRHNLSQIDGTSHQTIELDEASGWIKNSIAKEKTTTYTRQVGAAEGASEFQLLRDVETTFTVTIKEIK